MYAAKFPGRNFKKGEVIDLDGTEDEDMGKNQDDAVMILDSDEEDTDDKSMATVDEKNKSKDEEPTEEVKKNEQGWGEYDDGDSNFWGASTTESSTGKNSGESEVNKKSNANNGVGMNESGDAEIEVNGDIAKSENDCKENKESSEKSVAINGDGSTKDLNKGEENCVDTGNDKEKLKVENGEEHLDSSAAIDSDCKKTLEMGVCFGSVEKSNEKEEGGLEQGTVKDLLCNETDKSECINESQPEGVKNDIDSSNKSNSNENGNSSCPDKSPSKEETAMEPMSNNISVGKTTIIDSLQEEQSNDSDDVICIESGSAAPNKLHTYLSKSSSPADKADFRQVEFMSCNSTAPSYVRAKVGAKSWGTLIHFNFTGDPGHLPTAMRVEPSTEEKENGRNSQSVYERVFPPIKSLLSNSSSQGAVIRQRFKPLPCVNTAKMLLLNKVPGASSTPLSRPPGVNPLIFTNRSQSSQHLPTHLVNNSPLTSMADDPKQESLQNQSGKSPISLTDIRIYLLAFGVNLSTDTSDQSESSPSCVEKLSDVTEVVKQLDAAAEEDRQLLLCKFHNKLHDYLLLKQVGVQKESIILKFMCSQESIPGVPPEVHSRATQLLVPAQVSLLQERLQYLNTKLSKGSSSVDPVNIDDDEDSGPTSNLIGESGLSIDRSVKENADEEDQTCKENVEDSGEKTLKKNDENSVSDSGVKSVDCTEETRPLKRKDQTDSESESGVEGKKMKMDISGESKNLVDESSEHVDNSETKTVFESVDSLSADDKSIPVNCDTCDMDTCTDEKESDEQISSNGDNIDTDKQTNSKQKSPDTTEVLGTEKCDTVDSGKCSEKDSIDKSKSSCEEVKNDELQTNINQVSKPSELLKSSVKPPGNVVNCEDQESTPGPSVVHVDLDNSENAADQICIDSSEEDEEGDYNEDEESEVEVGDSALNAQSKNSLHMCNPLSAKDDAEWDTLVMANSSDEEESDIITMRSDAKAKWRPCLKKDRNPPEERLHLMLEEVRFLIIFSH